MTPLKDTLEVASPADENSVSQPGERTKSDGGQLRSNAVSLDVPVKVHGSRVTDAGPGTSPQTEPFEEQTSTMIVFPQGGVLRMSTSVTAGQMVVLTNLKSGHDAICRVVKVRAYAQTQSYVELEFTNRQMGYWGVHFAGDQLEPVKPFVPSPPPIPFTSESRAEKADLKPAQNPSWTPAAKLPQPAVFPSPAKPIIPAPERTTQANKTESTFVAIGAREEVQPAASATSRIQKAEKFVTPSASLSMAELRGDAHAPAPVSFSLGAGVPGEMTDLSDSLAETSEESSAAATLARIVAAAGTTGPHSASPQKAFGARFDSSALGVAEKPSVDHKESSQNWFLIASGIAALLIAAAGGAYYFHVSPGENSSAKLSSAPAAPSLPARPNADLNAGEVSGSNPTEQNSQTNLSTPGSAAGVSARGGEAAPERSGQSASTARVQASAGAPQKPAKVLPDMTASLNAHPVSSQHADSENSEPAPAVEAASAPPASELQGIASSSAAVPPPPTPVAPVKIGGDVKPPKVVSTVLPVYPAMARNVGIEGNVIMDASIDQQGKVVATKFISGPPVLRQAAEDALRRWKYQPATLNGEPTAVHITVTMQFHK